MGVLRLRQTQGDPIPGSVFRLELPKGRDVASRHLTEVEATGLERYLNAHLVRDTPDARREIVPISVVENSEALTAAPDFGTLATFCSQARLGCRLLSLTFCLAFF